MAYIIYLSHIFTYIIDRTYSTLWPFEICPTFFGQAKKDWRPFEARSKAARSPSPVPDARKAGSPVGKPLGKPLENHGKTIEKPS
jgi:hypothetical protein